MALLCRRRWLGTVKEMTQFSQWRAETAVVRLMHGVDLDGKDIFAALRRAFLASQVPVLAKMEGVASWMHVLGAVEEQDPLQAKALAREAWAVLAVTEESLIWLVQTAHFVDDIQDLRTWFEECGLDLCETRPWLEALKRRLEAAPALGRYGPVGDSSQLRARHLSKAIADLARSVEGGAT